MSDSRKIVDKSLKLTENRCTYAEGGPITPRSLADAWTPPEEAYPEPEKEYPLTGKFLDIIGEYPSIIKNAVANTVAYPHDIYTGEKQLYNFDPETGERHISDEAIGKALDVSNAAMTGGFGLAAIRPPVAGEYSNTLRMFAGPNSKTADLEALASAKDMIKNKVPAEEVRQSTGWELTPHGHWRYEISDKDIKLTPQAEKHFTQSGSPLDQHIESQPKNFFLGPDGDRVYFADHPELFAAYPELAHNLVKGTRAGEKSPSSGYYSDALGVGVKSPSPEGAESTLIHEMQHWIQRQEGWPSGASMAASRFEIEKALQDKIRSALNEKGVWIEQQMQSGYGSPEWKAIQPEIKRLNKEMREAKKLLKQPDALKEAAWDDYFKTAGEVESRNSELRRYLSDAQRKKAAPATTQDVPYEQQIVKYRHNAEGGAVYPLHRAEGGEASWWDKAGDYLSYIPITKHPMVQAALYALDPTPANEGEDETARQIAHGLRSGWEGSAETPVERKFGGKTTKSGPVVEQALMLTLKKASSRRGRPD
jgi:hypothetical protein